MSRYSDTGLPLVLHDAFSCFASDVITQYAFGRSYGFLDNANFLPNLRLALKGLMVSVNYVKHFPWLFTLMDALPEYRGIIPTFTTRGANQFSQCGSYIPGSKDWPITKDAQGIHALTQATYSSF